MSASPQKITFAENARERRLSADPSWTKSPSMSRQHSPLNKMTIGLVIEAEQEGVPNSGRIVSSAPGRTALVLDRKHFISCAVEL